MQIKLDDAKEQGGAAPDDALRVVGESLQVAKRCMRILKEELEKLA